VLFLAALIEERGTGENEWQESESRFPIRRGGCASSHLDAGMDELCTFFNNRGWQSGRIMGQELETAGLEGVLKRGLEISLQVYTSHSMLGSHALALPVETRHAEYRWMSDQGVFSAMTPGIVGRISDRAWTSRNDAARMSVNTK